MCFTLYFRPEGTPYSAGCFIFDIFFPTGYPKVPPMVNLQVGREGRMCAGTGIIFVRGSILNSNLKTLYHVSTVLGFCMKTYLRLIT